MSIRKGNIIIANKTIPSIYTAGDGITINNEVVSAKPDNKTITIDENAKIAIKPITVNSTTSTFNPDFGETFTTIDTVLENKYGQITKVNTKTVTLPTVQVSDITDLNVTATELNYVEGVTSNIQTQLNDLDTEVNTKVDKTDEPLKIYGTDDQGNQFAYNKEEVGQIIQVEELPTADATNINKIYQYIGETNQNYTNGVFYKNVAITTIEQWVSFEPSTIAGTVCTCSYEDFRAWLDTIFALDPLEVASGHFGFYSGTPDTGNAYYSVRLNDADGNRLKSISMEVTALEAAGFTFNPYLSAQDGLDYTCAVDKQVTTYTWTPIYVQKKNIIFVDWG